MMLTKIINFIFKVPTYFTYIDLHNIQDNKVKFTLYMNLCVKIVIKIYILLENKHNIMEYRYLNIYEPHTLAVYFFRLE